MHTNDHTDTIMKHKTRVQFFDANSYMTHKNKGIIIIIIQISPRNIKQGHINIDTNTSMTHEKNTCKSTQKKHTNPM